MNWDIKNNNKNLAIINVVHLLLIDLLLQFFLQLQIKKFLVKYHKDLLI